MATTGRRAKPKSGWPLSLVGIVQAGFPAPGDELAAQQLSIDDLLISNPAATYLMRVTGLSMKNIGIFEGDLIVVDRSKTAKNGDIVVVFIEQGFSLKRLRRDASGLQLVAEHERMPPIRVSSGDDFTVWGVVTGVVRQL